jgi:hypothetical protein
MTLEQAQAYQQTLKSQGKTESTSKEAGKLADYIATLQPEKNSDKRLSEAYSKLSRGVTEAGGWTERNLDNIEQYTGVRPQLNYGNNLSGLLESYQSGLFSSANDPKLRNSLYNQLAPAGGPPDLINRVDMFENMREDMGVGDLEQQLSDLKLSLEEQYAMRRQRTQTAEGGQVAMGVIAGRVGEIERQENERIDAIGRQISYVADQLNSAYNVIQTYIQFAGMDYQDASQRYNEEFNRNIQIYNMVQADIDRQQAAARANLQIFTNAIISGNIDYNSLSSDQKAFLSKLEAQSGLPIGFTGSLRANNINGEIISTTTRESGGTKYADVVMRMPDGSMKVQTMSLGASSTGSGGTSSDNLKQQQLFDATIDQGIDRLKQGDTWGTVWKWVKSRFPDVPNELIDYGLGTQWREGGAWEQWMRKQNQAKADY